MRLLISGGGTAGHVYPAFAVAQAVNSSAANADTLAPNLFSLLWIGSRGGIEHELVMKEGIDFVGLAAGGLRGMNVAVRARNAARIAGSILKARDILGEFRPDVALVTGGYACVAVTLAARLENVPVLIYLPDIEPGLAIRFLSRFATQIAVTSQESRRYLPRRKVVVTGYPVRSELFALDRIEATRALGLDPEVITLLVFGGSRGARSINRALVAGLRDILPACQVLHVSGPLDAEWVSANTRHLDTSLGHRYHHRTYLHEMPKALVAADLAVARAGAAALGEFPAAGLPAILVPYPYSGQHQAANAGYMAQNGAARVLPDRELDLKLVPTVLNLLADGDALAAMRNAARALASPGAAGAIARVLVLMAQNRAAGAEGVLS